MTLPALKSCPFCGGEAQVGGSDWHSPSFFVQCMSKDCYCAVGEGYDRDAIPDHRFASEEEAIAAWNHRSPSDRDGERYRFMRDRHVAWLKTETADECDARIDAAIAGEKNVQQG